jgi:hypothetical protein
LRGVYVNKKFWLLFRVVIVLILATVLVAGCGKKYTVEDGVISEVTMAAAVDSEGRPIEPTDVFSGDTQAFYCSFKLSHFPPGTKIKAEWTIMAGQAAVGISNNTLLQTNNGTVEGDGYTYVVMQRSGYTDTKWPSATYKVVLSVEGEEKATVSFKVD